MAQQWSTGLCDCCAPPGGFGNCLYTSCCGPCSFGDNVARMPAGPVCCGGSCYGACCGYCCLQSLGVGCFMHMNARSFLRQKYNLEGDGCTDFLITWCCAPCAMCQEHRELNVRGMGPGGVETKAQQAVVINQAPQMIVMQQHPGASPYPPPYNQPPPPPPGYGTQPPQQYPQQQPQQYQPQQYPQQQYAQQQYEQQQQQYQQQYQQQPQQPQQQQQQQHYPPAPAPGYPAQQV